MTSPRTARPDGENQGPCPVGGAPNCAASDAIVAMHMDRLEPRTIGGEAIQSGFQTVLMY